MAAAGGEPLGWTGGTPAESAGQTLRGSGTHAAAAPGTRAVRGDSPLFRSHFAPRSATLTGATGGPSPDQAEGVPAPAQPPSRGDLVPGPGELLAVPVVPGAVAAPPLFDAGAEILPIGGFGSGPGAGGGGPADPGGDSDERPGGPITMDGDTPPKKKKDAKDGPHAPHGGSGPGHASSGHGPPQRFAMSCADGRMIDCWLWRIDIHAWVAAHYFPWRHSWYASWFGRHPCYSSWWWCEWWPSCASYPAYVACYPTYRPVCVAGGVIYYPYFETPAADHAFADAASYDAPDGLEMPEEEIAPQFAAALDELAADPELVALLEAGAAQFRAGDYRGAALLFEEAALAARGNALPKFALAHALFALGDFEYAAYLVVRGMELLPEWPWVGPDLRDLYGDLDDLMEHTIALDVHLRAHAGDRGAAFLLGYVRFFSGDLDGAEAELRALAESAAAAPEPSFAALDAAVAAFLVRAGEIRELLAAGGVDNQQPAAPPR